MLFYTDGQGWKGYFRLSPVEKDVVFNPAKPIRSMCTPAFFRSLKKGCQMF